jgi:hypothetical protein
LWTDGCGLGAAGFIVGWVFLPEPILG